ncbi:MAG: hypothetical protein U5R49_24275 [Deltaproteobacteria bacterium]|nr:hypothetical protein [Deltaproteobacteria bacterium]
MEQLIVEILRAVGVYGEARKLVDSDERLAELFQNDFEELIRLVKK